MKPSSDKTPSIITSLRLAIARPHAALWHIATLLALSACAGASRDHAWADEPDPRASEYVIGASDELDIHVWRNGELSTKIVVRPDGRITMPLIGDVAVAGLTPTQVKQAVTSRLTNYITEADAVVTVAVTSVNSYHVTVSGYVASPGRYASSSYLTVADAIALAGGPSRFADPDDTVVMRRDAAGSVRRIPVDYEEIIDGTDDRQNIVLMRDDVVYMP
jgi:polysaccharide export outer membrane protein